MPTVSPPIPKRTACRTTSRLASWMTNKVIYGSAPIRVSRGLTRRRISLKISGGGWIAVKRIQGASLLQDPRAGKLYFWRYQHTHGFNEVISDSRLRKSAPFDPLARNDELPDRFNKEVAINSGGVDYPSPLKMNISETQSIVFATP